MRAFGVAILLAWVLSGAGAATSAAEIPAEPDGYRLDDYRAPTPATLAGAAVVTTEAAEALSRARTAVFVDVLPHAPKPAKLPVGTIWRDPAHDSIPGSAWLPEVGRGALAPETEAYFRSSLEALAAGDHDRPLVFFCRASCWMSWNAAKRALSYGYRRVSWYPDGVDGWAAAKLPLERATPYVLP
jgi:PQQ-dependent catabolism-associated CXXCW motif protein